MAEREEPQEGAEGTEPPAPQDEAVRDTPAAPHVPGGTGGTAAPGGTGGTGGPAVPAVPALPAVPLDEEAAWAQIVAAYGDEPDGPGGWPAAEDLPDGADSGAAADGGGAGAGAGAGVNTGIPSIPRAFVVKAPPLAGPRDYPGADDEDEGHFVPPEPPPLPAADVTTKFAWIAVLGGPVLMLTYVLTGTDMPAWAMCLGVGGFLGGFATLIARMRDPEDGDDDPHGGAVV